LHELDERAQLARRVGAIRIVEMKRLVRRQKLIEFETTVPEAISEVANCRKMRPSPLP